MRTIKACRPMIKYRIHNKHFYECETCGTLFLRKGEAIACEELHQWYIEEVECAIRKYKTRSSNASTVERTNTYGKTTNKLHPVHCM